MRSLLKVVLSVCIAACIICGLGRFGLLGTARPVSVRDAGLIVGLVGGVLAANLLDLSKRYQQLSQRIERLEGDREKPAS